MTRFALLALVAACTTNGYAKTVYDDAESGSTWQLAFGAETHHSITCPAPITARVARLPDGSAACDPGCTCAFGFQLEDDGDGPSHDYSIQVTFDQHCATGTLSCLSVHGEDGDPAICDWRPAQPSPWAEQACEYPLTYERQAH